MQGISHVSSNYLQSFKAPTLISGDYLDSNSVLQRCLVASQIHYLCKLCFIRIQTFDLFEKGLKASTFASDTVNELLPRELGDTREHIRQRINLLSKYYYQNISKKDSASLGNEKLIERGFMISKIRKIRWPYRIYSLWEDLC